MQTIFDFHCDLPEKVLNQDAFLEKNSCQWALNRIPNNSRMIQFFAHYVDQSFVKHPFEYISKMLIRFKNELSKHHEIVLAKSFKDIAQNKNKHIALLSIEGGEALEGKISNLHHFYEQGVRLLTLTWNYENELGFGALCNNFAAPLKPFGIDVIREMEKLNMVIDVSHLNEGGFWSVAEHTSVPFVASHSNAKHVRDHKRNLSDNQIRCIIQKNGLIGLNLYPPFLAKENATVTDILKHIEHFLCQGAENHLTLGCDFDGIDITLDELQDISCLLTLYTAVKNQFGDEIVAKIFYENGFNWLKLNLL